MHVVIAGCGRVGSESTVRLSQAGHTVGVIDKDSRAFERLPPGFDGQTFVGYAFDREILEAAGIRDAEAFVATTSGDNSNIVSARIAREFYEIPTVVARIADPRRAEIYRRLGIPTVATVHWAATQIMDVLFHGVEHPELAMGDGDMLMVRMDVPPRLAGLPVAEINDDGRILVVAIDRMGGCVIATPDARFQESDTVHVLVQRDAADDLRARLGGEI